jgi:hypothetical protein
MLVAWTGHRPDLFRTPLAACDAVQATTRELAGLPATRFLLGGQRGVDTWAALAAIEARIPFEVVLPCGTGAFSQDWAEADRSALLETLARADAVSVAGGFTERNRVLAESADLLVAVWTRTGGGGTAQTIDLARLTRTPIRELVLAPSAMATSARGRGI